MLIVDYVAKNAVGKWLDRQYLAWQTQLGEKKTWGEFADYLTVSRQTLDRWSSGDRKPDESSVALLARKTGDFSIYDIVGLPKPSKDIQRLIELFPNLTMSPKNY